MNDYATVHPFTATDYFGIGIIMCVFIVLLVRAIIDTQKGNTTITKSAQDAQEVSMK